MMFWILFSFIIINAHCQWVPSGTIPDSVIALSPDGSTAIAHTGIYVQTGSSWTLTQPFTFYNMKGLFLSRDGAAFAMSNSTSLGYNIDIYKGTNGIWTMSSIIYGSSLGVDSEAIVYPAAVTSDGKTMVVVSNGLSFGTAIFILVNDGINFNFQQQLFDLPYLIFQELSYSLDGSTLAILWRFSNNGEYGSPVYIFSRGEDGVYKIVEEHSSFSSWYRFTISSDSQYLIGATYVSVNDYLLFFFSRINNRYQLVQVIDVSDLLKCYVVEDLRVSSRALFVFFSCSTYPTGSPVFILQQSNQTSWSVVQTLTDPQPGDSGFGSSLQSSFDGSTLLSSAYDPDSNTYVTFVYNNSAIPSPSPPQATTTASATASASSSSSSTASASATSSTSATSTSSSSATHSASISSTGSATLTQTPSWSASPTNNADNASSLSPFSSPSVTITISVLSTALILFSIAVFVNWLRKYYIQSSSVRLYAGESRSTCKQEDDDGENQRVASGDPLLYRIN